MVMPNTQFLEVYVLKSWMIGAKQSERCHAQGFKADKSITILMA